MKGGVGYSTVQDSRKAARAAAEAAIAGSGKPVLTFLFVTDSYEQQVVLDEVKEVVGDSKIIGLCGAGIITADGVFQQAVAVGTLSGADLKVATSLRGDTRIDPSGAGRSAAKKLLDSGIGAGTVIVIPDGFAPGITELLCGMYDVMGPDFNYLGGGAGDNLRFFKTYQFTEEGVDSNSVAMALIGGVEIGTCIGHGWRPKGDLLVITQAEGKKIREIDARPAFDVYSERLGGVSSEEFPAVGMRYPLGTADISGNYLIRDPIAVNEDKSIDLVTEIPANVVAHIMEGNAEKLVEAARTVAATAARGIAQPQFALVFDCISRYLFLGDDFGKEVAAIREEVGNSVPLLGILTFGEIGSYRDFPQLHNKTLVMGVMGNKSGADNGQANE